MQEWKTISRQTVLTHSKFLTVENHTVQLPDGQIIADWPWVITPDYVNVIAITKNKKFIFFRQTKYAISGTSLAPVGGFLEPNEDALLGAKRELLEETGYKAPDWSNLGQYRVDSNRGAGIAYFFLAQDARKIAEPESDDLEQQQFNFLTEKEVEAALVQGDFKVLPWAAIVALALHYLRK